MAHEAAMQERFDRLKVCVLVPTYNNAATLPAVLESIMAYTTNIIVVDDGSTDSTPDVLERFPVTRLTYGPNRGKGMALRKGFKRAVELGYDYAITIDSDGQHFAKDLPTFLDKLEEVGECLIIGSRNMDQDGVPGKSSFGNKFSNFWYRVETGIKMPDTQSGYRLYPVKKLARKRFFTVKYEFEIEVIVRAAWSGIKVTHVPVSVYYPPADERISHFRPFKDFTRISILNTVLVLITFLYIKPRDILRKAFNRKMWSDIYHQQLMNKEESAARKASSVGFGVFMGIIPIWGFQLLTAIFLAMLFKLNKPLVIIMANISIPPLIPIILWVSHLMGGLAMGSRKQSLTFDWSITLDMVKQHLEQYLIGAVIFAITAGLLAGLISFVIIQLSHHKSAKA